MLLAGHLQAAKGFITVYIAFMKIHVVIYIETGTKIIMNFNMRLQSSEQALQQARRSQKVRTK